MARRLSANSGIKNGHRSGRNRASPLSRLPPRMSYIRVADRDDRARLARRYGGRDECTPSNWPGSVDLSWNFTLEARKDESVHGASTEVSFHVVRIVPPAPQCELVAGVVARLRCRHATAGRQAHCVLRLCRYAQGYAQKRRRRTNRQHCRHHDLPHVRPPRVSCAQSSLRYRIAVCAPVVTMVFRMTQRILWRSIAILKDDRSQDRLALDGAAGSATFRPFAPYGCGVERGRRGYQLAGTPWAARRPKHRGWTPKKPPPSGARQRRPSRATRWRRRSPARPQDRPSSPAATRRSRRPPATPPCRPTSRPCRAGNATSGVASKRSSCAPSPACTKPSNG